MPAALPSRKPAKCPELPAPKVARNTGVGWLDAQATKSARLVPGTRRLVTSTKSMLTMDDSGEKSCTGS